MNMRKFHMYTDEQLDYIRSICKGRTHEEIRMMFNERFGASVTLRSIGAVMYRNQIKNNMQGHATRFSKKHEPWNKGMKGLNVGGEAGWFKKGDKHMGSLPIGTERMNDGRMWIKVADPSEWEQKHLYLWRKTHGEIPDGHVIRFKDGDHSNVVLGNLFCVERAVMTSVVKRGLDYVHPDLRVAIHNVARVELKAKSVGLQ